MISVALFGIQGTASHYFLAIHRPGKASILLLGRQVLAIPLFLILPRVWGFMGLYVASALSEAPFALVAAFLLWKEWRILRPSSTDSDSDEGGDEVERAFEMA